MSFERWMQQVDDLCRREFVVSIHDLPDMNFYDAYVDGLTPEEFMTETIPDLNALADIVLG